MTLPAAGGARFGAGMVLSWASTTPLATSTTAVIRGNKKTVFLNPSKPLLRQSLPDCLCKFIPRCTCIGNERNTFMGDSIRRREFLPTRHFSSQLDEYRRVASFRNPGPYP